MDLIDGFPNDQTAYIGFYMINHELLGQGIGTKIISEVFHYLYQIGFTHCRLGIDRDNPQSNHFWKKNGFRVIREVMLEAGVILVSEKQL